MRAFRLPFAGSVAASAISHPFDFYLGNAKSSQYQQALTLPTHGALKTLGVNRASSCALLPVLFPAGYRGTILTLHRD